MYYKWIGATFVIAGCSGVGFSIAANYRREERLFRHLIRILDFMRWELQYKLTPLPELCRQASRETTGLLQKIFLNVYREMDCQISPDVCSCMTSALEKCGDIPSSLRRQLLQLSHMLGRFDLPGQLQGLQSAKKGCEEELTRLMLGKDSRLRSYQTLGICAGTALAILLV